jgi:FtsP/CotA-like multicopper oxidase with cupredoxin domain
VTDTRGDGRLSRRALLGAAAAGAVTILEPGLLARAAPTVPFRRRLPLPEVLDGRHVRLPMVEAEVPILPGAPTRMWTYGGSWPGPLIRRPVGRPTKLTVEHKLGERAGELTVHLHGGHNRATDDGQPGGLTRRQPRSLFCDISADLSARASGNDVLIRPGAERTYTYDFREEGSPTRGRLLWYHDHRLDTTARNNWRGLQGMWISEDAFEASLPLPRGDRELPLLIGDRTFDRHNQLTDPFAAASHAPNDGVTGRRILVNGAVLPFHRVEACRYRLRVLNGSSFRAYNLGLRGGGTITQIGTESGLMPRPVTRSRLLIGPGERLDLIVDFSGVPHRDVELVSAPRPDGPRKLGSQPYMGPLMQFRVGRRVRDRSSIPAELRPLPAWVGEAPREPSHDWKITVGAGFSPRWLINGRTFDPGYADHRVQLGTIATWRLVNRTAVAHLLHLHHTDWYLLARNGRPPAPHEAALKETFFMDPGDELLVAGRFSDYAGKYVVHCHMLDHEDHGLMSQFETYA